MTSHPTDRFPSQQSPTHDGKARFPTAKNPPSHPVSPVLAGHAHIHSRTEHGQREPAALNPLGIPLQEELQAEALLSEHLQQNN